MDDRDFTQQMQRLSDEELTEIANFGEKDGYLPAAVEAARKELIARNLSSTEVSTIARSISTRRNREIELASQPLSTVRIRRLWAAYLAVYAVFFVLGAYFSLTDPRLTIDAPARPFQVIPMAVDLLVMYGLFGFVTRRPIRQVALRVAFIVVAAFLCVRVAVVLYAFGPFSMTFLLGTPLQLPAAFALWVYATKSRRAPSATLVAQEFD